MMNARAASSALPPGAVLHALRAGAEHVISVERRNLRWEVRHNGLVRPMIDWLCTRERAVEHAVEMAEGLLAQPGRERVRLVLGDVEHILDNVHH